MVLVLTDSGNRGQLSGDWGALLQTLVELGLTDDWQHMIDSTTVCGPSQAAGANGGLVRRLLIDHSALDDEKILLPFPCSRPPK